MEKSQESVNVIEENSDIINLWEPLEFKVDDSYDYIPKGFLFPLFSNILYNFIALPILSIVLKVIYDLKIEGRENIKNLQGGAVSVSNHVLFLDCAMVGVAYGFRKIYYTTRDGSFKIPFVRKLIKLLRAIPIPSGIKNKGHFVKAIDNLLEDSKIVHFYPEASMWPYHDKIRRFKNGAFNFAIRNNVPVIPIVISFRKPKGIRKIFKRKPDVTLTILKPTSTEESSQSKEIENILKEKVQKMMEETLKEKQNT